jgi:hypothetical protein
MRQNGRKSTLAIVGGNPDAARRIATPEDLTEAERERFAAIVRAYPADWFDAATEPLLKEYVRLRTTVDTLAEAIRQIKPEELTGDATARRYSDFCRLRNSAQKTMATLATKMRLAQQSRYDDRKAGRATSKEAPAAGGAARKPWESE